MRKAQSAFVSRTALDERVKQLGTPERYKIPVRGWIKAIREALGMSAAQLAQRLGVKQPTVTAFEQSELRETIELATLRRVATAMECTLVYAFLPNKPLESIVRERARAFARRRLEPIEHSMMLEDQRVAPQKMEAALDEIVREANPKLFWD